MSAAWATGVLALEGWSEVSTVFDLPATFQEQWQERVAIMAVDGGVPEVEAQHLAWRQLQATATYTSSTTPPETV